MALIHSFSLLRLDHLSNSVLLDLTTYEQTALPLKQWFLHLKLWLRRTDCWWMEMLRSKGHMIQFVCLSFLSFVDALRKLFSKIFEIEAGRTLQQALIHLINWLILRVAIFLHPRQKENKGGYGVFFPPLKSTDLTNFHCLYWQREENEGEWIRECAKTRLHTPEAPTLKTHICLFVGPRWDDSE